MLASAKAPKAPHLSTAAAVGVASLAAAAVRRRAANPVQKTLQSLGAGAFDSEKAQFTRKSYRDHFWGASGAQDVSSVKKKHEVVQPLSLQVGGVSILFTACFTINARHDRREETGDGHARRDGPGSSF